MIAVWLRQLLRSWSHQWASLVGSAIRKTARRGWLCVGSHGQDLKEHLCLTYPLS